MMLVIISAAPADAVGGGCRLSTNWWVTTSANWVGNQLTYVSVSSPGALLIGGTSYIVYVRSDGVSRTRPLYYVSGSWHYRADSYEPTASVTAVIYGGNGRCTAQMFR
jgi:hypothetical protein